MATFTDIYKQELKGKGVLNSLGTAALKRTREKLDIRNMLFGGSGAIAATGQKVFGKGYQAIQKGGSTGKAVAENIGTQSIAMDQLLISSQKQESQLAIIAKNTMNSNAMARDMNVMRQNIMKLVTMGGGKASRGADMFFKEAAAREASYESQFKKGMEKTPTSVNEEKKKSKSILGIVLLALGALGTIISVALKKMEDSLGGVIKGLGKTIIDGIVSALTGLGILKGLPLPTPGKTVPTPGAPGKTVPTPGAPTPGAPTPGAPTPGAPKPGAPKIPAAVVAGGVLAKAAVPVAAIAAVVAGVKIHDADKKEYLDLAKKKRDEGLTREEEARIRKLSTISFRAAATQILNYDPIEGKASEAKTSGQIAAMQKREALKIGGPKMPTPEQYATGLDEEIRMARENLKKEEQAAKLAPNRPLVEQGLAQQREKLQKLEQERNSKVNEYTQATSSKSDASYATAEAKRFGVNPESLSPTPAPYNPAKDSQSANTPTKAGEVSENLVNFVKKKEGFSPRAFWDHKQWSIGYGTKSTEGEIINEQEADKRMREVLQKSQDAVLAHARKNNYDFNQNQVDALSSFVYNLGPGILNQLTGNGSRSIEQIAAKIPEYNKASEKIVPALQKRRAEEYAMFTSPGSSTGAALASASTASSDLNRASSTQPPPQVNVTTQQTNNNVAGGKGATPQVASATNVDALELFFKYAM
jgi:GH24 family phage-related lysozyme (muramidase)